MNSATEVIANVQIVRALSLISILLCIFGS